MNLPTSSVWPSFRFTPSISLRRSWNTSTKTVHITLPLLVLLACGGSEAPKQGHAGSGNGTGNEPIIGGPGSITVPHAGGTESNPDDQVIPTCTAACSDFPSEPIIDTTPEAAPPANAASLFGAPDAFDTGDFCVVEPQLGNPTGSQPGALMPANWVQPRFRFTAPAAVDLFEIRLSHASQ